ncbi:MAG TPA: acetate--CoA ligase family protein [Xanthobacteraceae bacterium]|nr:acetate--CoA ligase family protein [Xanthobacteraceae bacterium]
MVQGRLVSGEKVDALLNPRNVIIVGATDKPGNWPQRVWRNLKRFEFPKPIYPFNPSRDTVWDTRCYRTFAELPEAPDHLVVLAPAKAVAGILRDAAAAGARSATIMTSGFEEAPDEQGRRLGAELRAVIAETGLAISGPNCLGNFNAAASFFSLPDDRAQSLSRGPVAVVGQSGGIAMAIKRTLEERGVFTDALVTSGNETGLTTADYIAYFGTLPQIKVIACYLESVHDADSFLAALRRAKAAGKHVVVMKLGASAAGREAAAAHTGALAGTMEAFDAVAGKAGATRVRSLDELIEATEFLVHAPLPRGKQIGSVTFSGGMRGLLLDAAEANGMTYKPLSEATTAKMKEILSVGSIIGNPLDAGFAALSSNEAYIRCVETLLADDEIDMLLLQEELLRAPGSERKEKNLHAVNAIAARSSKPIAYVSMVSYGLNDYARELRARLPNVAFMQDVDKTLRTMHSLTRHIGHAASAPAAKRTPSKEGRALLNRAIAANGPRTLDEVTSKGLLAAYGLRAPREVMAKNEDEAVRAARSIGYPVVAKIVSAALPHKSDIGGVKVGLADETAVRDAFRSITAAGRSHPGRPQVDGVLIAQMISGGLELVLGSTTDPEMGPVILFGSGGIDLELTRDVALAACPLDEASALDLIGRTRAGVLVGGYRGKPALDRKALVDALLAVSNLMGDADGAIAEIDVNPFLLTEKGGFALDALVVLKKDA